MNPCAKVRFMRHSWVWKLPLVSGSTTIALLSGLQTLGCSEDGHPSMLNPSPSASSTVPAAPLPFYADTRTPPVNDLAWTKCDWTTSTGVAKNVAECATMQVPVRRGMANTRTIDIALKRYRPQASVRGQLWLINGGPGAAASDFETALDIFSVVGKGLEIYLLDHRGTGRSNLLSCPAAEATTSDAGGTIIGAEWVDCSATQVAKWGDDLGGFNVTEAATDLGEAIARTRHGTEDVYLYSVSYGTYLTQRYLQIYPDQPSGVVLDSICSPDSCKLLLAYDKAYDQTAQDILAFCGKDAVCSEQLGTDPYASLQTLEASLDAAHCSGLGWSRADLRHVLGFMVMYVGLRDYTPAVIKRLLRCSDNDVKSLKLFQQVISSIPLDGAGFSQVLSANIALSEMSEKPLPTQAAIAANVSNLAASLDAGPRLSGAIGSWPTYPLDAYVGQFAETTVPMLMLNGTLDPQTPIAIARPTGDHFTGTYQQFVEIPYAAHTTLTQSPIDANNNTCGAELIRQFLAEPTATLNTSCLDFVLPLDFSGSLKLTQALFGTDLPFADSVPKSTNSVSAKPLTWLRWPMRQLGP